MKASFAIVSFVIVKWVFAIEKAMKQWDFAIAKSLFTIVTPQKFLSPNQILKSQKNAILGKFLILYGSLKDSRTVMGSRRLESKIGKNCLKVSRNFLRTIEAFAGRRSICKTTLQNSWKSWLLHRLLWTVEWSTNCSSSDRANLQNP